MALDQPEKPEQPEILMILRRMRKMDVPYTDGGYEDQPYILMLELDAAVDTENEHWARIRLNQAAQAGAQNNGNTNPGALPASLRKL